MGRTGILPAMLARVHPRFGTPHVATTATFLLCVAGLLLPSNLIFLFLAVNIPTLLKYGATSVAAIRVTARYDGIYEQARLKLRRGVVFTWAAAGVACAAAVIVLGLETDWRPYAVLGGWALAGSIVYLLRVRAHALPAE
jgi:APA family basic amino acid/polyamine antiporter